MHMLYWLWPDNKYQTKTFFSANQIYKILAFTNIVFFEALLNILKYSKYYLTILHLGHTMKAQRNMSIEIHA